jgi:2-keto-4-pentenoate hydratase/2-oxohepta-3-ene-1,7-dioic acid hydratase in catechol pathway
MRLVSYSLRPGNEGAGGAGDLPVPAEGIRTGVVAGDEIVDLTAEPVGLPADMAALLALGPAALSAARAAPHSVAPRVATDAVRLHGPVPRPAKVLAIGMNYGAHVAEMGGQPPEYQYWFNKQRTCVVGHGDPIEVPAVSDQVDYEGELAMVIGRRCAHVPAARALQVVAGFTILNDVSVRDWQWRTPTFTMGKSFPTHAPTGPCLVTTDEVGDPGDLAVRTWVNDELRQDSTTSDLIFSCREMIEYLTTAFPLEPGDLVSTGTPAGVGAGFSPPRWLRAGDTVRVEIGQLGTLENPVVDAPPPVPEGLD